MILLKLICNVIGTIVAVAAVAALAFIGLFVWYAVTHPIP